MSDMIQKIDISSAEYPVRLREIPNPPRQLYCKGDISLLHADSVAVVGSRKYTLYGRTVAGMIGRRLGECGIPVTSGLAYGIDAFAHEGVLETGGRAISVLGSGINMMSPQKNRDLMNREIAGGGLVLSEYEPDVKAERFTFPQRNRIISGLSVCTVVVEANVNSGSLITAQHAMEQGRPVYAVPGNINSQFSVGCNLLIRDGAIPLVVIDDLLSQTGLNAEENREEILSLGGDERLIYDAVSRYTGAPLSRITEDTGLKPSTVSSIVTIMEIKGIFTTYAGKVYISK